MFSKREGAPPTEPARSTNVPAGPPMPAESGDDLLLIPGDAHGIRPLLPAEGSEMPPGPFGPAGPEVDVATMLKPLIDSSFVPTGDRPGLKRAMLGDDTLDPDPYMQVQGRNSQLLREANGTPSASASLAPPAPEPASPTGTGPLPELELPPVAEPSPQPADLVRLQAPPLLVYALVQRIMSGFPQGVLLDKTPEIEQMLAGRFIAALSQVPGPLPPGGQEALFTAVMDEVLGLGPLQSLVNDSSVSEVMVNGPDQVWVERDGHTMQSGVTFQNEEHVARIAQRILKPLGRPLDRKHPVAEARLPDGSRVNIIAPPAAVQGTTITIRKFSRTLLTLDELVAAGTLTPTVAAFLQACVAGRINILVSGGAGSGKTTLLNALASFVPSSERIVTVEESAQLRLDRPHVVSLEAVPAGLDGSPAVGMDLLVSSALKMRPERIVVDELRGHEPGWSDTQSGAAALLHAMNTGFDGSLATLYATSPPDALARLEAMAMAGRRDYVPGSVVPPRLLREQIASAVDLVVHLARLRDGSRRVTHISEVQGMEGDAIILTDIFRSGPAGLLPTGHPPSLLQRLALNGQHIDPAVFDA